MQQRSVGRQLRGQIRGAQHERHVVAEGTKWCWQALRALREVRSPEREGSAGTESGAVATAHGIRPRISCDDQLVGAAGPERAVVQRRGQRWIRGERHPVAARTHGARHPMPRFVHEREGVAGDAERQDRLTEVDGDRVVQEQGRGIGAQRRRGVLDAQGRWRGGALATSTDEQEPSQDRDRNRSHAPRQSEHRDPPRENGTDAEGTNGGPRPFATWPCDPAAPGGRGSAADPRLGNDAGQRRGCPASVPPSDQRAAGSTSP